MQYRSDVVLRVWAIAAMVVFTLLLLVPANMAHRLNELSVGSSLGGFAVRLLTTTVLLVVVLGFYLRMLWECGFAKDIPNRSKWLIFLLLIPIVSAFIYFWVSRSGRYGGKVGPRGQK